MHVYSPESIRLMSHSCRTDRTKVTPCLVSVLSNTLIRGFVLLMMALPLGSVHVMEGTGSPLLIHVRSTDWPGSIPMFPDDTTILTGTVGDHRTKHHCYISHKQTSKQTTQKKKNNFLVDQQTCLQRVLDSEMIGFGKYFLNNKHKQENKTKTKTYLGQLAQN